MDADKQTTMENVFYPSFEPDLLLDQVPDLSYSHPNEDTLAEILAGNAIPDVPKRPDLLAEALLQLHLRLSPSPVASAAQEVPEAISSDRRKFPRQQSRGHASVLRNVIPRSFPREADLDHQTVDAISGEVLDLSRNGLAFVVLLPLKPGEEIRLRLSHPAHSVPYDVTAHVIRTVYLEEGLWNIVAQFDEPLPFEAAYDLCEHLDPVALLKTS